MFSSIVNYKAKDVVKDVESSTTGILENKRLREAVWVIAVRLNNMRHVQK